MSVFDRCACLGQLAKAGIAWADAVALRRISMTLHGWHELECGNGNDHGSWAIERDDNGDGPPFMVHHHYLHGRGKDYTTRTRVADREKGAQRRLGKLLARYPGWQGYIQSDPRGCALYMLPPGSVKDGEDVSSVYNRGIAVYK